MKKGPKFIRKCSKINIKINTELKYLFALFLTDFYSILGSLSDSILDNFLIKMERFPGNVEGLGKKALILDHGTR